MKEQKRIGFVGRENNLEKLNLLLKQKVASLVVIKGRRRIGKSRLVSEFCKGKHFVKFVGLPPDEKITAQTQRDEFARQLQNQFSLPMLRANDWGDLFTALSQQTSTRQIIVVFDELSWMGSKDPTFLGKLKTAWDEQFQQNPKFILILCSSVSPWIEKHIISSTGYFGRVSTKITLDELNLRESSQLLDATGFKGSPIEKLMILSITGGVPWYIELVQAGISANENIKQLCFQQDGMLVDEFDEIFHDLFNRRGGIYKNLVEVIAKGPIEYQDIAKEINYTSSGQLSEYLHALEISGFIRRDFIWSLKTGVESKKSMFRLKDNYTRFYLKYIKPNLSKINSGKYEFAAISALPGWSSILGLQFENLVLNNRPLIYKALGIRVEDIEYDNPYFQHKTNKTEICQFDYMIQTKLGGLYILEIKFSRNEIPAKVAVEVKEKIQKLKVPKSIRCIPVLIYVGELSDALADLEYFDYTIDFANFLL